MPKSRSPGTVMAFSLEAIAESKLDEIIAEAGEEPEPMSFVDKINSAFENPISIQEEPTAQDKVEQDIDFLESAMSIVGEAQYKTPEKGMSRGKPSDGRHKDDKHDTSGQGRATAGQQGGEGIGQSQSNKGSAAGTSKGVSKGAPLRYEERVAKVFKLEHGKKPTEFQYALHAALHGIAT